MSLRRLSRRGRSWALAAILSLILIVGWAVFLAVAPAPEHFLPPRPAAVAVPDDPSSGPGAPLRLLARRGVIDAEMLAAFTADAGIKVTLATFDTNEQLLALAAAGDVAQDLVVVSGIGLKALADAGLLAPLTKADLANVRNIDPAFAARTAGYDAGNAHSVPLFWGTIGLGFNATQLAERLGGEIALDSWAALFDPARAAKLASCGIQVMDSPLSVFPIALAFLGLSADTAKLEDTDAATRLWEGARPFIGKFSSQDIADRLATGQDCLAVATSGEVYQARIKARMAGLAHDIRYALPKEGAVVWYDVAAIPKASAQPVQAMRLIDFLLRPEVAARLSNTKGVATAVLGAGLYIKPEIKTDAALTPDLATDLATARLVAETSPAPEVAALRNRFWQLINAPGAPPAQNAKP